MSDAYTLRLEPEATPALREQILAPLIRYNEEQGGPGHSRLLAITLRDESGAVVGGLYGRRGYGFLFIELLSMGTARGQGFGRRAMEMAEAEARAAGLDGIWLDTWTFQAPEFYPKLGFVECGRIKDYPPGHDRIFYVKRFTSPS